MLQTIEDLEKIIQDSLREDIGDGDHTSLACIPKNHTGRAKLIVKDKGVIAGVDFAKSVFKYLGEELIFESNYKDGDHLNYSDIVFNIKGPSQKILLAERVVLNSMQRMSAIATKTAKYVALLDGTKAKILDTRKTTPGIRVLEKWAVRIGGGENHRFGLYDMIMLKDNHIDFSGGIILAIKRVKDYLLKNSLNIDIIVEARNIEEVIKILESGHNVKRILLDNFSTQETLKAVSLIGDICQTESSGGINEKTIRDYAECGVDYISVGEITHSINNMDLSLKAY